MTESGIFSDGLSPLGPRGGPTWGGPLPLEPIEGSIEGNPRRDDSIFYPMTHEDLKDVSAVLSAVPELTYVPHWEDEHLEAAITAGGAQCYVARHEGKLIGAVIAGSFGVRGTISHLWVHESFREAEIGRGLVEEALNGLRASGVRRAHVMVNSDNEQARAFWGALGFSECAGERFLQRHFVGLDAIGDAPSLNGFESCVVVRRATAADTEAIAEKIRSVPELAFGDWEVDLLKGFDGSPDRTLLIATDKDEVVGVLIGGSFGLRGTITHIWVKDGYRDHKIGRRLAHDSFLDLCANGAKRIHIMLTSGNEGGFVFWNSPGVGLVPIPGETFLEKDI